MHQFWRRLLSLLLIAATVLSLGAVGFASDGGGARTLTEADYAAADELFAALGALADQPSVYKNADDAQDAAALLGASELVVPGSVEFSGEQITWQTTQGITCVYSPRLQEIDAAAEPVATDLPDETTAAYTRGAHGRDVYLFQPYYGLDSSFTTQYQREAERIAQATEGSYHYYKGNAATIDAVADAIEDGGVILFDSHGSTDYESGDDYTSGATTSYLCLQTGEGLTDADYSGGHAKYGGAGSNGMRYYLVDGTAIANHMEAAANGGLVWMAICLGMATDGLEGPFMANGVGAVYGYSQSVTFVGDYCFEEAFFDSLLGGATIAEAAADMKDRCGEWDYSARIASAVGMPSGYVAATEDQARQKRAAFPIFVSDADPYPGHGKVDAVQDVKSDWNLLRRYELTADTDADAAAGTVSRVGMTITAKPAAGYYAVGCTVTPEGAATVRQDGNTFRVSAMRSDCTVTIHFAAKTAAKVHFVTPDGVTQNDISSFVGESVTLPTPAGTPTADAQDYYFVGWSEEPIVTPSASADYIRAGQSAAVEGTEKTYYAVYQFFARADGGTPAFTRVESAPGENEDWSGTYVLTGGGYALLCDGSVTGSRLGSTDAAIPMASAGLTDTDGTLAGVRGAYSIQITRAPNSEQYSIRLGGAAQPVFLACRSNEAELNTSMDAAGAMARWTIAWENGAVVIRNVRYPSMALQFSASQKFFRCMNTQQTALTLYRGEDSGLWYTTSPTVAHAHDYVKSAGQAATCTQPGWAEYACSVCGASYREETASALGHSFTSCASDQEAKPADCTHAAEYYVQCDRCDAIDTEKTVASGRALGHDYQDGKCTRCGEAQPSGGIGGGLVIGGGAAAAEPETETGVTFRDVPETAYFAEAASWAASRGIVRGTAEGYFVPDAECTRAQAVLMLYRAAGEPEVTAAVSFTDVKPGDACYKAVAWAVSRGIVRGTTETTFSPNAPVTRAQAAAFLWRLAGSPAAERDNPFTDVRGALETAARWAAEQGITRGVTATIFAPNRTCTRAQLVTFLYRAQAA